VENRGGYPRSRLANSQQILRTEYVPRSTGFNSLHKYGVFACCCVLVLTGPMSGVGTVQTGSIFARTAAQTFLASLSEFCYRSAEYTIAAEQRGSTNCPVRGICYRISGGYGLPICLISRGSSPSRSCSLEMPCEDLALRGYCVIN
jgi:hypothetical protein